MMEEDMKVASVTGYLVSACPRQASSTGDDAFSYFLKGFEL